MKEYQLVCDKFAIWLCVNDDGRIVATAPIAGIFVGQKLDNLVRWAGKFSETKLIELAVVKNET